MRKRVFALLMALCLIVGLTPVTAMAADDLTITTAQQLRDFAESVTAGDNYAGKVVTLGRNIDLSGSEWTPIGGASVYFAGEFDGNGHVISGLTQTSGARMGLFGLLQNAYIHDLTLRNVNFTVSENDARVGAVAGNLQHWNVIENVTIDGINITVNGDDGIIGAVAGFVWKSQLGNVDVKNAVITVNGDDNIVGGNSGYVRGHVWDADLTEKNANWLDGTVIDGYVLQNYWENCDVNGIEINLNGTGCRVGGFAGSDSYNNHTNYFVSCHVSGLDATAASGTSHTVGGFMGYCEGTTTALGVKGFENCSASGSIEGANGSYGGFFGIVCGRTCSVTDASADVDVSSSGTSGGFVGATAGYADHEYDFTGCTASGDVSGAVAGGFAGENGLSGDGHNIYVHYEDCTASGSVSGTECAGGFIGKVDPELPETNWNIVGGTGSIELVNNTVSSDVSGDGYVGSLIGYYDGIANGDAEEGNKIDLSLEANKVDGSNEDVGLDGVNASDDTEDGGLMDDATVLDYVEYLQAQLLKGNDVVLDRDIVLDASYARSVYCAANGNGETWTPGIFTVAGGYGDGEVTFDLNGHSIRYNGHADAQYNTTANPDASINSCEGFHALFYALNGGNLTVLDSAGGAEIEIYGMASAVASCAADSVVTVSGGSWKGYPCQNCGKNNYFIYAYQGGEIFIDGGSFAQSGDDAALLCVHGGDYAKDSIIDYSLSNIVVCGGTFVGMDPAEAVYLKQYGAGSDEYTTDVIDVVGEGYVSFEKTSGTWIVIDPDDYKNNSELWDLIFALYGSEFKINACADLGGSISPSGVSTVKYGESITYTITPDEGYVISNVLVDGVSVGNVSEFSFKNVKDNHKIYVVFVRQSSSFSDVSVSDWFFDDVKFVNENGLMIGTDSEKNLFSPYETLNRAMIVTILWRLEGSPVVSGTVFADVASGLWYTDAVNWAASNGLVKGYGNGNFGPMDDLTREQLIAVLHRYAALKGYASGDEASGIIESVSFSAWAREDIIWADKNAMFDGIGADISVMTDTVNRAETAAYLSRFCMNVAG